MKKIKYLFTAVHLFLEVMRNGTRQGSALHKVQQNSSSYDTQNLHSQIGKFSVPEMMIKGDIHIVLPKKKPNYNATKTLCLKLTLKHSNAPILHIHYFIIFS